MAELGLILEVLVGQGDGQFGGDEIAGGCHRDGFPQGAGQALQTLGGTVVEKVAVDRRGQRHFFLDAVQPGGQDQPDDQIRIAG